MSAEGVQRGSEAVLHRSYLYAPGSEPRLMRKALTAGADAVVLDLEDAVAASAKPGARAAVAAVVDETVDGSADPARPAVHVRVNRDGDGYHDADLDATVRPGLDALRLPKVESAAAVADVAGALDRLEGERGLPRGHIGLYLTVESARGALKIAEVLDSSERIRAVALGAADLLADLGASGDDDLATLYIRSQLVLLSRGAGIGAPIDSVSTDLDDSAGLERAARRARALGFGGKSVIHPRQLPVVHRVFTPTASELDQAERIVAALPAEGEAGTAVVGGRFVDAAVVARARAVLDSQRRSP